MRIQDIRAEHKREGFRLIRDIGLAVLSILGPVATVWAIWIHLEVWALVMALALALLVSVWLYYKRRIRAVPYLKEGKEAQIEATKLLETTKEILYYYGGVSFISDADEWHAEYTKKLQGQTIIKRFLDVKSREDTRKMLKGALGKGDIDKAIEDWSKWHTTHCENLETRAEHNHFYHFEGAPIWRYGLHCIIFDEKHIVMPFASGKSRDAVFIRDCPNIAKALARCLDGLIHDFDLRPMSGEQLAAKAKLPQMSRGKE